LSVDDLRTCATFILCFVLVWATPLQKSSPLNKVPTKDIDSRIINGDLAGLGQFPWQAALYANSYFRCSGSIISEQWILTSASCIYGSDTLTVVVGVVDLNGSGVLAQSSEIIPYYDYNPNDFHYYNIGLVQLSTPLTFSRYVAAITLAENLLEDGADVTTSGWGSIINDGDVTQLLYYADLVTIRNSECTAIYGNILESVVCAESVTTPVKNACYGDAGNPMVVDVSTNPVHVGVSIFISSNGCDSGQTSGFTRIFPYVNWIRNITNV
jgi:secreted trypsin-like serine protease